MLSFEALRKANVERLAVFPGHADNPWSANDWAVAVTGELGELCNILKKLRRGAAYPGMEMPSAAKIRQELADTQIYLDLLAAYLGVDLGAAVIETFNNVSERWNLPQRLEADNDSAIDRS